MMPFVSWNRTPRADHAAATAALLGRLARGDSSALGELYRRESGPVYRYALALCGNAAWAADATEEALVVLATRAQGYDPARGALGAYLAGVARHARSVLWRGGRLEQPLPEDDEALRPDEAAASPEDLLVSLQDSTRLWDPLRRLPVPFREAIMLVDLQERRYAERMREWARSMVDRERARTRDGSALAPTAPTAPTPPTPPIPPGAAAPAAVPMSPTPPAPPAPQTPPTPVVITRIETINSARGREAEMRMFRPEAGAPLPPAPGGEMAPPAVQFRALTMAPRGAGTVSPLPSKDIDGVRANGERTSWVIEAGKVGNERAIQITPEVWTSPELMVTLSSRDFDPRSGEQNYRLKNLKRGEPEAALMRVPGDYAKPAPRPAPRASGASG